MKFRQSVLLLAMSMLLPIAASAQSHGGTMKESWDKAPKEDKNMHVRPSQKAPAGESGKSESAPWSKTRTPESRPWPFLPAHPGPKDFHAANAQIIDSLHVLYCVSNNYLRALSARNDAALNAGAPQHAAPKDFSYDNSGPAPASRSRESLQSLHKDLLDLLAQCLGNK